MMLNKIVEEWNTLYKKHPVRRCQGNYVLDEDERNAQLRHLTINGVDAIDIPSKKMDTFNCFGAFTNGNCDGILLIKNSDGTCDLVFLEMKSKYSTEEIFGAKNQIIESLKKVNILLNNLYSYDKIHIKRVYGIIACIKPDLDALDWIKQQTNLPEDAWKKHWLGLKLHVKGNVAIDTRSLPTWYKNQPQKEGRKIEEKAKRAQAMSNKILPEKMTFYLQYAERDDSDNIEITIPVKKD